MLAENMFIKCLYYVPRLFFKDFAKTLEVTFIIFWKVRKSYFQGPFLVAVSENDYVSHTVERYTNLLVTCLISTKN